ncbi:MAG: cytochrome c family protein [Hyphomicrobiales bacterium]|nr:cytochrome c family protein [Hyphomicrobiales bacterium]
MGYSFKEKFGLAVLLTAWLLFISNAAGNFLVAIPAPDHGEGAAHEVADKGDAGDKGAAKDEKATETAAAEDPGKALAMIGDADVDKGRKLFKKCAACHTPDQGGKNKVGPNLWDIVGRPKASHEGFKYSDGMQGKGGEWTFEDLNHFLAKPKDFVPGTKMAFAGLKKDGDRAEVLAYLRTLSDSPKPLP